MNNKTIFAIAAIAVLEAIALWRGIDGAMFGAVIAAVSGLGGYSVSQYQISQRANGARSPGKTGGDDAPGTPPA